MSTIFQTILFYISLLGTLPSIVKQLEATIGLPNTGQQKLDFVLSAIEMIFKTVEVKGFNIGELTTIVKNIIDAVVGLFNKLGIFSHGATSASSTPTA